MSESLTDIIKHLRYEIVTKDTTNPGLDKGKQPWRKLNEDRGDCASKPKPVLIENPGNPISAYGKTGPSDMSGDIVLMRQRLCAI